MILRDRITVTYTGGKTETIRASVGTLAGSSVGGDGRIELAYIEKIRAIIDPNAAIFEGLPVKWRELDYKISEPPIVRRKHGHDHHLTITLERFNA